MARITPNDFIKGITGKVCSHSQDYYSQNTTSGIIHTGKICHPYTGPATEKEVKQQEAFKTSAKKVTAWLLANRPTTANPKGSEDYQLAQRLKKQYALSNVRQVAFMYLQKDGSVVLPSGSTGSASDGGSSTPGAGGGDEETM